MKPHKINCQQSQVIARKRNYIEMMLTSCLMVDTSLEGCCCACNRVNIALTSVASVVSRDCTLFASWSSLLLICSMWLLLITKLSECICNDSTVECCKCTEFVVPSSETYQNNIQLYLFGILFRIVGLRLHVYTSCSF